MKRRMKMVGFVAAVLIIILAAAWRAWDLSIERLSEANCAYYPGSCTYIVAFPVSQFPMPQ
ncbi:hypothetical protein PTE30175_01725 [Pandoraea terrae]|uniref:Uncharacterized protein n=1 Tax=Pandoraea terrae TaxID=1537710 RepID=A0A5E4U2W5_9BURK|nr:hypothetical protein PTE30175_01725 [Pandoraea terrae]